MFAKVQCGHIAEAFLQYLQQYIGIKNVVAHRGICRFGVAGNTFRLGRFFVKLDNPSAFVGPQYAESGGFGNRNRIGGYGYIGFVFKVEINHLPHIHTVDMIRPENSHQIGGKIFD